MLDSYASKQRVSVVCNVSGRIDVRQAGPAVLVNFDTVRDPRAGRAKEIDVGVDTDPGDHKVAFELPAGPGDDSLDSFTTLQAVDAWKCEVTLAPTGGDQQPVIGHDFVAVEANPLGFRFELDRPPAEHEVDSKPLVFSVRRHERVFKRLGATKKSLR